MANEPQKTEAAIPTGTQENDKSTNKHSSSSQKKRTRSLNIYHHREMQEDGTILDIINTEFWFMPRKKSHFKPRDKNTKHDGYTKSKFKAKRKGANRSETYKPKPRPARKIEDSPFAALAALKDPKKD